MSRIASPNTENGVRHCDPLFLARVDGPRSPTFLDVYRADYHDTSRVLGEIDVTSEIRIHARRSAPLKCPNKLS
jgi:hypothetical protein